MPRRWRADFNGPAKLDQSDRDYNDRAEQVMIDVCLWHKADMLNALTNVRFEGIRDMTRT
jgi:hypothetical protein